MGNENRHRPESTNRSEIDFSDNARKFLERLFGESIGSPSADKKLDAIIEMLRAQAGVAADLALVKDELSIIHGLVMDLGADPEKANELSERIRKQTEALKSAQT